MSNYWSIAIGINQYHFLQPLMQAQNDALGLHRFLIDEVGFDESHSVLLSDLSVSARHEAVYPDQRAIQEWLQVVCQQKLGPDDGLWLFFSGYGAQAEGEDYLMPVDGDPANVAKTGLKISDIIHLMHQAPTQNQVLILDMNRSQSALAGQEIGAQTIELAKSAGIPLLLSCQPDQFSHETLAVRHGLFTAALLEGLRYHGCFTLAHLSDYLRSRLPELCEHHWRPVQNPVAVIPDDKKFMVLLPPDALNTLQISADKPVDYSEFEAFVLGEENRAGAESAIATIEPTSVESPDRGPFDGETDSVFTMDAGGIGGEHGRPGSNSDLNLELPEGYNAEPDVTTTVEVPDEPPRQSGAQLRNWGLLIVLLLLAGVAVRNQPFLQEAVRNLSLPEWATFDGDEADSTGGEAAPVTSEETVVEEAVSEDPIAEDGAAEDGAAEDGAAEDGAAEDDATETPSTSDASTTGDPADENAVNEGETDIDPDRGLPIDDPDADSSGTDVAAGESSVSNASAVSAAERQASEALLESARQSIEPNQASRFVEAIETVRQIRPGEPYYDEAQTDIRRWSRVILDMAEGRAAGGNLEGAIAAAQLVPTDQETVSRQAQQRIAFWQQRQRSRRIIQEAQGIPRTGQASTYQEAIFLLQQVPAGQPEYASAQGLIDEWSQKMLSIARARAAQGRNEAAAQAAALIPKGTAAYDQAQTDIQRWRGN
ncbi:MAG: caspase family protein [Cyanobacteria bacterium J06648_16]